MKRTGTENSGTEHLSDGAVKGFANNIRPIKHKELFFVGFSMNDSSFFGPPTPSPRAHFLDHQPRPQGPTPSPLMVCSERNVNGLKPDQTALYIIKSAVCVRCLVYLSDSTIITVDTCTEGGEEDDQVKQF